MVAEFGQLQQCVQRQLVRLRQQQQQQQQRQLGAPSPFTKCGYYGYGYSMRMVKGQSLPLLLCKTRYVYGKSYVIALFGTYVNKIHLFDVFCLY